MQITADQLNKIKQGIQDILLQEDEQVIASVMHPDCRVSVVIPAYDESVGTLLRPLLSLARQEHVDIKEFEVVVVANNSLEEALNNSQAFQANQRILAYVDFAAGRGQLLSDFNEYELAAAEEIRRSGLRVYAIDKSSPALSEETNYVARARNRGCMEIAYRFLENGQGERGIIAMTDADCRLSPGYICCLMDSFKNNSFLNGLNGAIEHEVDESLPHYKIVKLAFDEHHNIKGRFSPGKIYPNGLALKKQHKLKFQPLNTGQDMAVTVKSWILTRGVPDRLTGDDFHFGRLVENLEGDIGATDGYTVYPLARLSERAGFVSYGARLGKISKSVEDFLAGRSNRVLVPDIGQQSKLFESLSKEGSVGTLSGEKVKRNFAEYGHNGLEIDEKEAEGFAVILNREMAKSDDEKDYAEIQNYLLKHFGEFLPVKDVTRLVNKLSVKNNL